MHIHKPKVVARLGEFASEIAVITVGILIALAAEQVVEAMRWGEKVEASRREIAAEIRQNSAYYAFRVATAACVVRRLDELYAITEAVARHEHVQPVGLVGLHLGDLLSDNAWQNARADQSLTHFRRAEFEKLSLFYAQQDDLRAWVLDEENAWASLRVLEGDPNRLAAADLAMLRAGLQRSRNDAYLMALNAKDQLNRLPALGIETPKANPADVAVSCAPLQRTPPADLMGRT